jgi:predicted nucleic acid-binding protein
MNLVIDASTLVGEGLRFRGRDLLEHPALLLGVATYPLAEARHELARRTEHIFRQGRVPATEARRALERAQSLIDRHVAVVPVSTYAPFEAVARARVPRDPTDWPTVAAALALGAAIWTHDADFLGCGVATWTTETLIAHLAS